MMSNNPVVLAGIGNLVPKIEFTLESELKQVVENTQQLQQQTKSNKNPDTSKPKTYYKCVECNATFGS